MLPARAATAGTLRLALLCAWPVATRAGGAIFGGDVDFSLVSLNLIGIILFTIVFETLTEHLEEAVEESPVYLDVVHKVYKELMILGVLSFVLALSVEFGVHIPTLWLHSFEWAHMIIFAVAGLYLSNTILAIVGMEATFAEWVRAQNKSVKSTVDDLAAAAGKRNWRADADFKIVRLIFLHEYSLPKVFDYMSYVKRKLHANVRHTVHITVGTWLCVAIIVSLLIAGVFGFRATADDREPLGNATDDSHRRQLGGDAGGEPVCSTMYECESQLTARVTIGATAVVTWTVMFLELACVLVLSQKWKQVFQVKGIPTGADGAADADAVAASLKEWQRKVDRRNIVTRADYETARRNDVAEGRPEVTLMADLQDIYSESTEHFMAYMIQTLELLNCFCMAVYAVHVRSVIHSTVAHMPVPFLWDFVVVLPALIMVLKLNPLSAKKAALLGAMVRQDVEMVADVFAFTDEVRDLRNRLQTILVNEANASLGKEDEAKTELSNDDSAALAAKQMFDSFNKAGQTLNYTEVRQGLASLSTPVHMSNREFADVMHVVDPDQSGDLSVAEWEAFMLLSDAELEAKQIELNSQADPTAKLRKRLAYIPVLGQVAGTMDVGVKESGVDDEARALDSE